MKKFIFPAFVILMGAGAAFATKATTSNSTIVSGYRVDAASGQCIKENKCSTISGDACVWSVDNVTPLHDLSETMCGEELFKPRN